MTSAMSPTSPTPQHEDINDFITIPVPRTPTTSFDSLLSSLTLERLSPTRQAANLALASPTSPLHIPIVRTTTAYSRRVQPFPPGLVELTGSFMNAIDDTVRAWLATARFNNAMVELYDPAYSKMGWHTDQAQDLADDSWIAILSSYKDVDGSGGDSEYAPRQLVVKKKDNGEVSTFLMRHNECILFSTGTNAAYVHKIVGPAQHGIRPKERRPEKPWLGITLRTSKTYVHRQGDDTDDGVYFVDSGKLLRGATNEEKDDIRLMKKKENNNVGFVWPELDYALGRF